jgi:hypothetical protein
MFCCSEAEGIQNWQMQSGTAGSSLHFHLYAYGAALGTTDAYNYGGIPAVRVGWAPLP